MNGLAAAAQQQWAKDGCVVPVSLRLNAPVVCCKDNINDKGQATIGRPLLNGTSFSVLQFLSDGETVLLTNQSRVLKRTIMIQQFNYKLKPFIVQVFYGDLLSKNVICE